MKQPLQAETLSDFWGRRWNTAFRDFAHEQIFRPLCRTYSPHAAALGSFFFSGLIHELAISIPAGSGYGLPTIYFLLQWVGTRLEKHGQQQRWLICRGVGGRILAASFIIAPCVLLFHPAFVLNVIVPFIPNVVD
jgi:alginate O-acetyltransferase complex protein AlgI